MIPLLNNGASEYTFNTMSKMPTLDELDRISVVFHIVKNFNIG